MVKYDAVIIVTKSTSKLSQPLKIYTHLDIHAHMSVGTNYIHHHGSDVNRLSIYVNDQVVPVDISLQCIDFLLQWRIVQPVFNWLRAGRMGEQGSISGRGRDFSPPRPDRL